MLKLLPLVILAVYVVKGLGRYGQSYMMASVGERVIAALRRDLYAHIQAMPLAFFQGRHSADLMSRIVVDASRLARLSSEVLVMAFRQVCTVVALLVVMVTQETRLTAPGADRLSPGRADRSAPWAGGSTPSTAGPRSRSRRSNTVLQEAMAGTKIVKAFGQEAHEQARFDQVNHRLLELSLKDRRVDELSEPIMEILAALGLMGILWYGGFRVIQRRDDRRDPLLLRDRHPDAVRTRAEACPDREPRPADHALRRANLRDSRPPAGGGGRARTR